MPHLHTAVGMWRRCRKRNVLTQGKDSRIMNRTVRGRRAKLRACLGLKQYLCGLVTVVYKTIIL